MNIVLILIITYLYCIDNDGNDNSSNKDYYESYNDDNKIIKNEKDTRIDRYLR